MKKVDEVAAAFAELNLRIVNDILARGYSHVDTETMAMVRENLLVLKGFDIDAPASAGAAPATKTGKAGN